MIAETEGDLLAQTWNSAKSYATPDISQEYSGRLALYFKCIRGLNLVRLAEYLKKAARENVEDVFLLAFHIRDCRGGKGERELGRWCLRWLLVNYPCKFSKIFHFIPQYGRWDDLLYLFPSVLDLGDENYIKNNYMSNIKKISEARMIQNEIVKFFAKQLLKDISHMRRGETCSIAAKWAPSEGDSLDRKYSVVQELCKVLDRSPRLYRKTIISPLRQYLDIVERRICQGDWTGIDYSRVPSCCMHKLKKALQRHNLESFEDWLNKVKIGKSKINAKQLFPHQLVSQYMYIGKNTIDKIIELQWKVLVDKTRQLGIFDSSLVVCDVSGSMYNGENVKPVWVSVALGILISTVTRAPFTNNLITFETNPKFTVLQKKTLFDRVQEVLNMGWGGSTNIQEVFNVILETAHRHKLIQEELPKRVYIISDMQFNQADDSNSRTNYEAIVNKYKKYNYQVPQLVFWNVNGSSTDFVAQADHKNIIVISGFSTNILKSVLNLGEFNPVSALRSTLDSDRYIPIRKAFYVKVFKD